MKLKKVIFSALLSAAVLCLPEICLAEFMDGEREGFVFSLAMGGSSVQYKQYIRKGSPDTVTTADSWDIKPAFAFNTELGYGFSNQLQMVFFNNSSSMYQVRNINGKKVNLDSSLMGMGVCYFFDTEAPSIYINGGIGLSTLNDMKTSKSDMGGLGVKLAIGYEFRQNAAVDFSAMYTTNYLEESYADANVNSVIMSLAFKMMFY